jgi:hypothetical protein
MDAECYVVEQMIRDRLADARRSARQAVALRQSVPSSLRARVWRRLRSLGAVTHTRRPGASTSPSERLAAAPDDHQVRRTG